MSKAKWLYGLSWEEMVEVYRQVQLADDAVDSIVADFQRNYDADESEYSQMMRLIEEYAEAHGIVAE